MATAVMLDVNHAVPQADAYEDEPSREETQETTAQGIDKALPDASLHECRVEMVPLDDIYTKSDPYDDELNDDLIKALAHSISLIGLQNPICIVANDIPDNPASYRLVSGRKRYAAFLKLERTTIPAHILSFAEADSEQEVRKALATTEENLVRKHYSLIELCELVGQSKAMYERIHPTTQKGKAKKPKHSGTELFPAPVPKPLAYLDVAAQQLGKSRVTVWKYLAIYKRLIQGHSDAFAELKKCDHPILAKVEDLLELAQSDDIEVLTRLLCGLGLTPEDRRSKPRTLQEARTRLEQYRAEQAREKDQPHVQEKGHAGEEFPSQPPETPLPASTLAVPASSSALEMSTSQPCDPTSTPLPDEASVSTQHPATPVWDTASEEELTTVEDVLIGLDELINVYLRDKNLFKRFKVVSHKLPNELRITIQSR
jgi:ParB-like nuclease domain